MKQAGMAKHTDSAFNEGSANRLLADFLEQKKTIKTFFKENDRTPNYDGSFELVSQDGTPTKQFIVQIKKVENLTPNVQGENKGNYMYSLETNFLYYVKAKVTESPAIYFVVDIATKNIFWLYLSDELLMNMGFEGKPELYYPLTEADKITDIDTFTSKLNQIAASRNTLFLQKTPEQISEMQEALDFINQIMDNDFQKIKESVFPNLWRFGIKHSHSNSCSITAGGKTVVAEDTALFALYPQIKGVADTGLQEYSGLGGQYFNHWDMNGKTTPMMYVRNSLQKILKAYFENGISIELLPDIVLQEKLSWFVQNIARFYDLETDNGKIKMSSLYRACCLLIKYTQHIIFDDVTDENELFLKTEYTRIFNGNGIRRVDMLEYPSKAIPGFKNYCSTFHSEQQVGFATGMFGIIKKEIVEAFVIIAQLQQRNVQFYLPVWDYDYFTLACGDHDAFAAKMDEVCSKWFEELPAIYNQAYDSLFEKNKYRFTGRYVYKNEYSEEVIGGCWLSSVVLHYKSDGFQIEHDPNCNGNIEQFSEKEGLQLISEGLLVERFLQRKTPLYDAIHCLMYQGICKALDFKCNGLTIGGSSLELF